MKYVVRDCENCDGVSDLAQPQCRACVKPTPELDLVVYKGKVFIKEQYLHEKKIVVCPFFMDILIQPISGKVLKTYRVQDAVVRIVQENQKLQPTYVMDIPSLNQNLDQLFELHKKFEENDFTDPLLKTWIKNHGILYYLLSDPLVQEININPPEFQNSFSVVHQDFEECRTNIFPSIDFLNYLATYLKINTGRPLNKAQPQLDGELFVEKQRARVAAVIPPFSVHGIGYSIRKHRETPWTVPLFMQNQMVNEWFAGLMSFAIAHGRTFLIAGPRGSGKTALLGSLMLEILKKYRVITIEDTQELPVDAFKAMGYDLLALKVRSALMASGLEIKFDKGLRTSLRLGDSVLIVGEIRSTEAKVLYEAMRVGAMSNTVAGTIHADNPYGVYDRVVNDLGVPKGSFKVTDLIVIINQIKSASGLHRKRRVLRVTEVLKEWEDVPVFQDLLVYNPQKDELEPTSALLNGKSMLIKEILAMTQGYKAYDDALREIKLRAWARKEFLNLLQGAPNGLEAFNNAEANNLFTRLFDTLNPVSLPKNEEEFKKQFTQAIQKLVTT
ncbi:MAG: type II/IV secretion system ATPase subunit [Candidatus Micrarchaeota archaeon]